MNYLKEHSYYSNLYDHGTVEQCRWWLAQKLEEKLAKKLLETKGNESKYVINIMYIRKGERFRHKSETIHQWMERDRAKDEQLDRAIQPANVHCFQCGLTMECIDRDLQSDVEDKNHRVLFTFSCSNCEKGLAIWEGGEEWEPKPHLCTKCQSVTISTDKRKGNVITTKYTCPSCRHIESDKIDLDEKYVPPPPDPHFEEDRMKYCMSDKEGFEYVSWISNVTALMGKLEFEKKNKALIDLKAKIKVLPIAELQNLLNLAIEKVGYKNLVLGKPEFLRGVTVEFAAQDTQVGRAEYDSIQGLKKLIEHALKETNWRLIGTQISYRLGFLTGRLKGVEGDDDLLELAKKALKNETR